MLLNVRRSRSYKWRILFASLYNYTEYELLVGCNHWCNRLLTFPTRAYAYVHVNYFPWFDFRIVGSRVHEYIYKFTGGKRQKRNHGEPYGRLRRRKTWRRLLRAFRSNAGIRYMYTVFQHGVTQILKRRGEFAEIVANRVNPLLVLHVYFILIALCFFVAARGFGMRVVGGKTGSDGRTFACIVWTVPGGPAEKAGLQQGDKVISAYLELFEKSHSLAQSRWKNLGDYLFIVFFYLYNY